MTLIFLTSDFPPHSQRNPNLGGIGRWAHALATELSLAGEDCLVVARSRDPERDHAFDATQPFEIHRFRGLASWSAALRIAWRSRARRGRSLVIACKASLAGTAGRLRWLLASKAVSVVHGLDLLRLTPAGWSRLASLDGVVVNSRAVRDQVEAKTPRPVPVVIHPPSLASSRFPEEDPVALEAVATELGLQGRRVLLSVGRLIERKNHHLVLSVLGRLAKDFPDLVYVIAGEGPLRGELEAQVRSLEVGDQVRFAGYVEDVRLAALYQLAHVFVMPSLETEQDIEGFGIVFLEASYFGTPSIGARAGGVPDAVEEGVSGLLIDPESPAELEAAIRRLLVDAELHARLAEDGRRRVLEGFFGAEAARTFLRKVHQAAGARPGGAS